MSETVVEVRIFGYPVSGCSPGFSQPYNAMLSLHQLLENGDLTFCLDNEALCVIASPTDTGVVLTVLRGILGMTSLPARSRSRVLSSRI